jgi:hypothetical protein
LMAQFHLILLRFAVAQKLCGAKYLIVLSLSRRRAQTRVGCAVRKLAWAQLCPGLPADRRKRLHPCQKAQRPAWIVRLPIESVQSLSRRDGLSQAAHRVRPIFSR